ncbi:hypothetical protein SDC9_170417 [bioreactor metagenome]|uniref:Uncharacterized protein n=1 Tax=bioreactor metagenome TaxID=1076179 RepID=A0A645GAM6_9ZZZZ
MHKNLRPCHKVCHNGFFYYFVAGYVIRIDHKKLKGIVYTYKHFPGYYIVAIFKNIFYICFVSRKRFKYMGIQKNPSQTKYL